MRGFFLLSKLYVCLGISLKLVEIYKLYGLGLIFVGLWFMIIGLRSVQKTVGCLDPSIKNSYSLSVYIMAVHSLMRVESLSSTCVNSLEFAEMRFILFVPFRDYNNAAPMPKFEASHMA